MSFGEYSEVGPHVLFGYPMHGTDAQARTVRLRLQETPEWLRWHALDSIMRVTHVCAESVEVHEHAFATAGKVAHELAAADRAMGRVLARIIDDVLAA